MTTKKVVVNLFKSFISILVVALAIAFTFLHEYQPSVSKEYISIKKEYKKIINERDNSFNEILVRLGDGSIDAKTYISEYNSIKLLSETKLESYHTRKDQIKANDSVLGYTSFKNYLLGVAFPSFGLFTSLILLFIIVKNVKDNNKRFFYLFLCLCLIATWGYWFSWSVLNHTQNPNRPGDFPRIYYNICLYVLPIVSFFLFYILFNYYKTIEEKAANIMYLFYNAFYRILPEKGLVHPEKSKEFRVFRTELTKKAVENE